RAGSLADTPATADAEAWQERGRDERSGAVAAIIHHAHGPLQLADPLRDVVHVPIDDRCLSDAPAPRRIACGGREPVQLLDLFPVQLRRADTQLEPVVLGRIVRARD